jgi:hypothetical protein
MGDPSYVKPSLHVTKADDPTVVPEDAFTLPFGTDSKPQSDDRKKSLSF